MPEVQFGGNRQGQNWGDKSVSLRASIVQKNRFSPGDGSRMRDRFITKSKFFPRPFSLTPFSTHPFLQDLLFSNWSLIIPTIMSSETRPPASIITFAFTPKAVCFWTCSRSISPVAKWQTQKLSRMLGAWVPLPNKQFQGNSAFYTIQSKEIPAPGGPMRMVRSCWAGVGVAGLFGFASSAAIFALSWETSDFK